MHNPDFDQRLPKFFTSVSVCSSPFPSLVLSKRKPVLYIIIIMYIQWLVQIREFWNRGLSQIREFSPFSPDFSNFCDSLIWINHCNMCIQFFHTFYPSNIFTRLCFTQQYIKFGYRGPVGPEISSENLPYLKITNYFDYFSTRRWKERWSKFDCRFVINMENCNQQETCRYLANYCRVMTSQS